MKRHQTLPAQRRSRPPPRLTITYSPSGPESLEPPVTLAATNSTGEGNKLLIVPSYLTVGVAQKKEGAGQRGDAPLRSRSLSALPVRGRVSSGKHYHHLQPLLVLVTLPLWSSLWTCVLLLSEYWYRQFSTTLCFINVKCQD